MSKFVILVSVFTLISCGTSKNADNNGGTSGSGSENIVDVFQESPYRLKEHQKLTAPDSLIQDEVTGSVVFAYTLGPRGKIIRVNVMKLRLRSSRGELIADFF
jgi:hypothetical protein